MSRTNGKRPKGHKLRLAVDPQPKESPRPTAVMMNLDPRVCQVCHEQMYQHLPFVDMVCNMASAEPSLVVGGKLKITAGIPLLVRMHVACAAVAGVQVPTFLRAFFDRIAKGVKDGDLVIGDAPTPEEPEEDGPRIIEA